MDVCSRSCRFEKSLSSSAESGELSAAPSSSSSLPKFLTIDRRSRSASMFALREWDARSMQCCLHTASSIGS